MLEKEDEAVGYDIQYDIEYDNSEDYSSSSCNPSARQSKISDNEPKENFEIKSLIKSKPFVEAYQEDFELISPLTSKKKAFSSENYIHQKFEINQFEELNNLLDDNMHQQYESDISAGSDDEKIMMNHEPLQHINLKIQKVRVEQPISCLKLARVAANSSYKEYTLGYGAESLEEYENSGPITNQIANNKNDNEESKHHYKNENYSDSDSHSYKGDYHKSYVCKARSWDKASRNNSSLRKHVHIH